MNVGTVLLVIVILLLVGALPTWPHGGFGYGWTPSGAGGIVLVILIILILTGRL